MALTESKKWKQKSFARHHIERERGLGYVVYTFFEIQINYTVFWLSR